MTSRHLVFHDLGAAGRWYWVDAASAEAIVEAVAEVEVITDPAAHRMVSKWTVPSVALDGDLGPLEPLRAKRTRQRADPGFAPLTGRSPVYLRFPGDPELLYELGPDGRALREVRVWSSGAGSRIDMAGEPINPPFDLWDPAYVPLEVERDVFEAAWLSAPGNPSTTVT